MRASFGTPKPSGALHVGRSPRPCVSARDGDADGSVQGRASPHSLWWTRWLASPWQSSGRVPGGRQGRRPSWAQRCGASLCLQTQQMRLQPAAPGLPQGLLEHLPTGASSHRAGDGDGGGERPHLWGAEGRRREEGGREGRVSLSPQQGEQKPPGSHPAGPRWWDRQHQGVSEAVGRSVKVGLATGQPQDAYRYNVRGSTRSQSFFSGKRPGLRPRGHQVSSEVRVSSAEAGHPAPSLPPPVGGRQWLSSLG